MCKNNENDNERIIKERVLWEKLAQNYDKQIASFENAYKLSVEKSKNVLKSNYNVLEIACGTGIISLSIANYVDKIAAIDISPKMISVAKEKANNLSVNNIDFQVADGYSLKYENAVFDAILLFNSLHIVKDPNAILRESYRLLKPNGYLITATDCYAEPVPFVTKIKLIITKFMKSFGIINYVSFFSKKDILNLIGNNNFTIIDDDILESAPVNYYVLGRKSENQIKHE